MFHTIAKLFLEYLIKFDEKQPLSRENHEVLTQIRTLISFVPPLPLPESPKSTSTADTDELLLCLPRTENKDDSDSDFSPELDRALDVIYDK